MLKKFILFLIIIFFIRFNITKKQSKIFELNKNKINKFCNIIK